MTVARYWPSRKGEAHEPLLGVWASSESTTRESITKMTDAEILEIASSIYQKHMNDKTHGYVDRARIEFAREIEAKCKKTSSRKKVKQQIPQGFSISSSVMDWANKNGYKKLEVRLEWFVDWAKSGGHEYSDWDAAFRNSIRQNWAQVVTQKKVTALDLVC